jgi:hypothetical protein
MTKTDRQQNLKNRFRASVGGSVCRNCAQFGFARHFSRAASNNKRRPVIPEAATLKFIP